MSEPEKFLPADSTTKGAIAAAQVSRPRKRFVLPPHFDQLTAAGPNEGGPQAASVAKIDVPLLTENAAADPELNWVVSQRLSLVYRNPRDLVASNRHLRRRSKHMADSMDESLRAFGMVQPITTCGDKVMVGHGRLEAALRSGMSEVPTLDVSHMTDTQRRAYAIAENKLGEIGDWNRDVVGEEIRYLNSLKLDVDLRLATGHTSLEFDGFTLDIDGGEQLSAADATVEPPKLAVARRGDVFILGEHRVVCGSATDAGAYRQLMPDVEKAQMVFGDPPWGVPISGHVGNKGRHQHREFIEGGGDMRPADLLELFTTSQRLAIAASVDGAMHFWCIDWAHLALMLQAGSTQYSALKNIICWVKPNSGLGSCYRSQHEMIVLQKVGTAPHVNNFGLGQPGRVRSNCWFYPGANSFGKDRDEMLSMHPTVKPVAMVIDAILDCSHQGDIVLDPFGGSGTTLIAAQQTKRCARLIELDPLYVDTIVMRWQKVTGLQAFRESDGKAFDHLVSEGRVHG